MNPDRPVLSKADLEAYDPHGGPRRWCCPLPGPCTGKPIDASHRSVWVVDGKNWHCYRCDRGGVLREFWQPRERLPRQEYVRRKAEAAFGLAPVARTPTSRSSEPDSVSEEKAPKPPHGPDEPYYPLAGTTGERYLLGRGISLENAARSGAMFVRHWYGYQPDPNVPPAERHAVVFPFWDQDGRQVARQGVFISGKRKPPGITWGPKINGLFSTFRPTGPWWWRAPGCVILTEAPIDALSLSECYYPAVALCGTAGLSWMHLLTGMQTVFVAFDADEAGDKAAAKLVEEMGQFGGRFIRLRPENWRDPEATKADWNDMLVERGPKALGDWLEERVLPELG